MKNTIEITTFDEYVYFLELSLGRKEYKVYRFIKEGEETDENSDYLRLELTINDNLVINFTIKESLKRLFTNKAVNDSKEFYNKVSKMFA